MGDVIKDFYKSDAPQFKGRSKEKRREMAIAAKLEAERGPQNESATEKPMSAAELALQKRKALLDKQITAKRQMALNKTEVKEACWKTHEQRGMKKKGGKMVPNCVRKGSVSEATYPSDFRNPDGSKRAVAKKKTGRPIQHDQPTSGGRRKTVDESAEDRLRDRRMERGGVGGNQRYDRPYKAPNTKKFGTGKTMAQKEMEKKYGKGKSALDIVKIELEKKHGKGSVK